MNLIKKIKEQQLVDSKKSSCDIKKMRHPDYMSSNQNNPTPYLKHGESLLNKGENNAAYAHFRSVLQQFPDTAEAYTGAMRAALQLGNADLATNIIETAQQAYTPSSNAKEKLSALYMALGKLNHDFGNTELSRKCVKKALRLFPLNDGFEFDQATLTRTNFFEGIIDYHLETLPRSGTHFLMKSLEDHLDRGFATTFQVEVVRGKKTPHMLIGNTYVSLPLKDKYFIKSHHTNRAETNWLYSQNCLKVIQISFFFDSLYSWAHLRYAKSKKKATKYIDYKVTSDSEEWHFLRNQIKSIKNWLTEYEPEEVLRYEDFLTLNGPMIARISERASIAPGKLFNNFRPDKRRLYNLIQAQNSTECIHKRFDRECSEQILDELGEMFTKFYPEISF